MVSSRFAHSVHILAALARWSEEPVTSEFLAGSVGTNPVVVRRLLGKLRQAGLVEVVAGSKGGARLALPPERIDLGTVYRAVESGEVLGLHPSPPNPACPVGKGIGEVLATLFGEAERALEQTLSKTTLADVEAALACPPPERL